MFKRALEEMWEDLELWFAPDPITGKRLPSMLVVALAMVIELTIGIILVTSLVGLLKYFVM